MLETWRWFGPNDPVSLENIIQSGASGVVTSLHELPTGAVWTSKDILERKTLIESKGLVWSVVESVPVHNDIKLRKGKFKQYIENYKESIKNLGQAGVNVVCYNFMPVVDWTRTNLMYKLANESYALYFSMEAFVAYDVFVLKRENACEQYSAEILQKAEAFYQSASEQEISQLEENIIAGLPGSYEGFNRDSIRAAIDEYKDVDDDTFRHNLFAFLREIVPVAEHAGVKLCIHPDDPPFSLFGLPRVVSTQDDARKLLNAVKSEANGLTMCAGSYGARGDNDLVAMVKEFAANIHFVHLRNIKRRGDGSFFESEHLDGDNDIFGLVQSLLNEERRRKENGRSDIHIPMRPDHGHLMADDIGKKVNPGYSMLGRMKGLAELRGVIYALERQV